MTLLDTYKVLQNEKPSLWGDSIEYLEELQQWYDSILYFQGPSKWGGSIEY